MQSENNEYFALTGLKTVGIVGYTVLRRRAFMRYFRVHTADIAYITQQPRGIFTAIGKLVDAGLLTDEEVKEYWRNREYFEKVLPVPPFYDDGNPDKATTWFKDTPEGNRIYSEMTFYREMARKYDTRLYISECDEILCRTSSEKIRLNDNRMISLQDNYCRITL